MDTTMTDNRLLTLTEAAEYLGLAVDHRAPEEAVRWLCRSRRLRFVKVGRTIRFRRRWLDDFIDREAVAPIR
jgi:excisionase family DNA binding protein